VSMLLVADPRARRHRAAEHRRLPQRQEAVTTAKLARELFGTPWIKLEVIADNDTLQPDVVGLVEARYPDQGRLRSVPYCTEDFVGRLAPR